MTITKAIALAALTGTLAFGPQMALAKSDHANGGNTQSTDHGNSGTAHQNNTTRSESRTTVKSDTATEQEANDTEEGAGAGRDKLTVGRVGSGIRGGNTTDFGSLTSSTTVQTYTTAQLQDIAPGNSYVAIEKALSSVTPEQRTQLQASLDANTNLDTALADAGITDISTVQYAYVDAQGNLVVITQ